MGNKLNQIFCKTYTFDLNEPINEIVDSYNFDQIQSSNTTLVSKTDLNLNHFIYYYSTIESSDPGSFNRNDLDNLITDLININLSNLSIKSIDYKIFNSLHQNIIEIDLSNNCLKELNINLSIVIS